MTKTNLPKLKIDEGFRTLIRPLRQREYQQLEANLLADGCRDPIIIWRGYIIDGHNRYELCHRHNISFQTLELDFESREEVIAWICANQLGRRNISEETRKYLIGKQYEAEKIARNRLNSSGKNQYSPASPLDDIVSTVNEDQDAKVNSHVTAQRIAGDNHVSEATVMKYAVYTRALEVIGEKVPELLSSILSGRFKISHNNVIELAKQSEAEIREFAKRLEQTQQPVMNYKEIRAELAGAAVPSAPEKSKQGPSIKDMPAYDPDADISGLSLTIPSWVALIARTMGKTNLDEITWIGRQKLISSLQSLRKETEKFLSVLGSEGR